jgi:hypothetical protein
MTCDCQVNINSRMDAMSVGGVGGVSSGEKEDHEEHRAKKLFGSLHKSMYSAHINLSPEN